MISVNGQMPDNLADDRIAVAGTPQRLKCGTSTPALLGVISKKRRHGKFRLIQHPKARV